VATAERSDHTSARIVLQAGGRGVRLRPATDSVPKPLLRVAGVPLIERLFRQLREAGFWRFTVVVGWLGDAVEEHVRAVIRVDADVVVDFIHEDEPLGNIGALRALPRTPGPTLFVCCDLFTGMDFEALVAFHTRSGADLTLASHTVMHQLEYGQLICEGDGVLRYIEKPQQASTVCSGVAVLGPAVLRRLERLAPPAGICDLAADSIDAGLAVLHWRHGAYWIDVNSPESLRAAEEIAAGGSLNGDFSRRAAETAHVAGLP
jgi:NDP-sugar pyrophosphorylase family protein